MLQGLSSESTKPLKPLIRTLATREVGFTEREYLHSISSLGFVLLLAFLCFILYFLINNEYRLQRQLGTKGYIHEDHILVYFNNVGDWYISGIRMSYVGTE